MRLTGVCIFISVAGENISAGSYLVMIYVKCKYYCAKFGKAIHTNKFTEGFL